MGCLLLWLRPAVAADTGLGAYFTLLLQVWGLGGAGVLLLLMW